MNRTIVEKARCLLFDAGLEKEFWAEATNTAVYLQNRTVLAGLNNKTPYELWTNKKPDISHLRVFGSTVMVHVPKEKRLKWDKKSVKCILVGYPDNIKGYRIYNPESKLITNSRDVIIIEKKLHNSNVTATVENLNLDTPPINKKKETSDSVGDSCQSDDSFVSSVNNREDPSYVPSETEESDSSTGSTVSAIQVLPTRQRSKPDRYGFSNMCTESSSAIDDSELTLEEALQGPEREHWLRAVKEELIIVHGSL
ncbi:unnamed protein product [Euphydryas editha]|uniref:Retroviral polymerase SH3-like domain-containing protein n=1 Tax=Euphydryas editha TaxID=104508 RepID=A0AAU9VG67_EUPED|nr:unnamed protein product [Euphydryas editha]